MCIIIILYLNMIRYLIIISLISFINSDLRNDKNIYYDENYNELHMNAKDYYDYLYNKYLEFNNNNTYNNTYNKYNFIENLKYHFNMKNKNNFNEIENSLIATNEKDYNNHKLLYNLNKSYNINNLLSNYYYNICNSYKNLCGNNDDKLYYYPYFNAYNVNVFNYIFNRVYKSFVNFDIEEMIQNVPNINKMTEKILVDYI